MRRVILESPFSGVDEREIAANIRYARRAVRDSIMRDEAPLASHLLYTQPGILEDADPEQRALGILAGLAWASFAEAWVVYTDRGISQGMQQGIDAAQIVGVPVEYRQIGAGA